MRAACDLTGLDSACLRLNGRDDERSGLVASIGPSSEFLAARGRGEESGLGAMAMLQGRLVVVDAGSGNRESLPDDWRQEGLVGGIAAPISVDGKPVGSLVICLRDEARQFGGAIVRRSSPWPSTRAWRSPTATRSTMPPTRRSTTR